MPERPPSPSSDASPTSPTARLSGLRLDELLEEVQDRLTEIEAAVQLVDARYGTLGVLGRRGGLSEFVYVGISPEQRG
jgi:hypothetical protein